MLFGNIKQFAIEYELDKNCGEQWLFGKIGYWINGERIGDYGLGTSLRDVLFQSTYILNYSGKRFGESLCELNIEKWFQHIDMALYSPHEAPISSNFLNEPLRYNICIPVEVFNDWKIYLIECNNTDFIVYNNINYKTLKSCFLQTGFFDSVFRSFFNHLESIYELNNI